MHLWAVAGPQMLIPQIAVEDRQDERDYSVSESLVQPQFLLPGLSTAAVKATRSKPEIANALHGNIQQTLGVGASASGLRERTDLQCVTWVSVQVRTVAAAPRQLSPLRVVGGHLS